MDGIVGVGELIGAWVELLKVGKKLSGHFEIKEEENRKRWF